MQGAAVKSKVLIGGGSGFIGSALGKRLAGKGYEVIYISRTSSGGRITWQDVHTKGIPDVDAVVQLSGANILDSRWTEERKKELIASRIDTTKSLVQAMAKSKSPPKVFVCGSAIGIYPTSKTEEFHESSNKVADNFAGHLVSLWEQSAQLPQSLQATTRSVLLRTGVVLGKEGGMMQKMLLPFKFGLGGPLGSGQQFMPWIHIDDLVSLHVHAIENSDVKGVLNAVAPQVVSNQEFTTSLASAVHRPAFIPMPEFAIKFIFGERAFLLLEGQKVVPTHTLASGFTYRYPTIDAALKEIAG